MDLRRAGNLICDVGLLVGLIALCVLDAGVSHRWRGVVLGIGTVAMLAAFLIGVPVRIVGWLGGRRARKIYLDGTIVQGSVFHNGVRFTIGHRTVLHHLDRMPATIFHGS